MISSIQDAWSAKHRLMCTSPGFEELSAGIRVVVETVADAGRANNKVTAQKIPAGAPRFRSFVQGDTSTLDVPVVTACGEYLGLDETEDSKNIPYDCSPPAIPGDDTGDTAESSE